MRRLLLLACLLLLPGCAITDALGITRTLEFRAEAPGPAKIVYRIGQEEGVEESSSGVWSKKFDADDGTQLYVHIRGKVGPTTVEIRSGSKIIGRASTNTGVASATAQAR